MVYTPEDIPAAPTPAKALPIIRAVLLGATAVVNIQYMYAVLSYRYCIAGDGRKKSREKLGGIPHSKLPNSNQKTANINIHFRRKYL